MKIRCLKKVRIVISKILEVNQMIRNFMKSWIKFDASSRDTALSAKPDAMVLLNLALAIA